MTRLHGDQRSRLEQHMRQLMAARAKFLLLGSWSGWLIAVVLFPVAYVSVLARKRRDDGDPQKSVQRLTVKRLRVQVAEMPIAERAYVRVRGDDNTPLSSCV